MRYTITFIVATLFSIQSFSQNLDIKTLIYAYNSTSVMNAFETLKNANGFSGKVFLTMYKGDSTITMHFGADSLKARRQTGKIIVSCSAFNDKEQFVCLKQQADKQLKQVEIASAESMGVQRNHLVYGKSKLLKKGDLRLILTKCFDKERTLTYYSFHIAPYPGY